MFTTSIALQSQTLLKTATPLVSRMVVPAAALTLSRRTFASCTTQRQQDKLSEFAHRMPRDIYREILEDRPTPMCEEFLGSQKLTSELLEKIEYSPGKHFVPQTIGDRMALYAVKFLRTLPDTYFGKDHYMRAVMLETIAAVPGMVGAMLRHMKSLRTMKQDNGWISHLLHEAENERMHLMTWIKCLQPSLWNRLLVLGAQGVFFNAYFLLYLFSPKTAHRMCGYLEEEAVISYTHFLNDIDAGIIKNGPAPDVAIDYYNLHPNASIRDVVLAVRADEAVHRDANHFFSDRIAQQKEDILSEVKAQYEATKNQTHTGSMA
ncbi:alternative oxidase-domain-containing protein [Gilbertella persicaria]|uniref:alternative oxidase-domain-containing protein n=1 Tax=Gilbertella persicaria TaxID=101096 RepID=UPI00221FFCE5|nr:alternative oxidase-domain-containing protein [Gilbertella persicaria]KAI8069801.1 alternative oxidase-domain-containing protein [Gilbertella persicaria]